VNEIYFIKNNNIKFTIGQTNNHNKMNNALTYMEYIEAFNNQCTNFKHTSNGPIAKAGGRWYSVNGTKGDIMDVRHALTTEELVKYSVTND